MESKLKCVVLCGGGTGGHVYPNLAIASGLENFRRVCYLGRKDSLEETLATNAGLEFFSVPAPRLERKFTLKNAKLPFSLISATKKAKEVLLHLSPSVVFSKGGYASLPVTLASISLGIPTLCHESDFSVGLANKIAYHRGGTLLTSFPTTMVGKKRTIQTGTPIRAELSIPSPQKQLCEKRKLLILGGSQGATAINHAVWQNLPSLCAHFDVVHITGAGKTRCVSEIESMHHAISQGEISAMLKNYTQIEYSNDINSIYNACDLCVSRGGANCLFELLQKEIPTLVIPLEKATRGDQLENAEYFSSKGLCHQLSESNMFGFFESVKALSSASVEIKQTIKTAKLSTPFDGRQNIVNLILSQ